MHEQPDHELPASGFVGANDPSSMLAQAWERWFGPEIERRRPAGTLPTWTLVYMAQALLTPDGELRFLLNDEVRGEVTFPDDQIGDFVLTRSDKSPTYNFTVVVDDIDMQITHVHSKTGARH